MIFNFGPKRTVEVPKRLILLIAILLCILIYVNSITSDAWTLPKLIPSHGSTRQTATKEIEQPFSYPNGIFDETTEGSAKISQVSMMFGDHFDLVYERALQSHIENGQKWGYPTHYLRQDIIGKQENKEGEGVYNKLLYLQTIIVNEMIKPFGKRSEWIVWFDADTVLINSEIPWSIFLPPSKTAFHGINMLVTTDERGFNAGVFLIRVCEWSIDLLADAIALPRLRSDLNLDFKEQSALLDRFDIPERKNHRLYVPRHWFNPYDLFYQGQGKQVMNGTMIIHFPGIGHETRAESMGLWLDKLDHTPEDLHIPLANTSYPAETEAFWTRLGLAADTLKQAVDFKDEVREAHIYQVPHTFDDLHKAEKELVQAIQDEAFNEDRIRAKTRDLTGMINKTKEKIRHKEEENADVKP